MPPIDPDLDSVDEMDAMLIERQSEHDTVEMLPVCVQRQYEVCRNCYSRLIADPLGIDSRRVGPFSRN